MGTVPRLLWVVRLALVVYVLVFLYLQWAPDPPAPPGSDRLGHFLLYLVFGVLLGASLAFGPVVRMRWVLVVGLVLGLVGEWGQGMVPGRTPDAADVAANWAGTMVAALVVGMRGPWASRTEEDVRDRRESGVVVAEDEVPGWMAENAAGGSVAGGSPADEGSAADASVAEEPSVAERSNAEEGSVAEPRTIAEEGSVAEDAAVSPSEDDAALRSDGPSG